MRLENGDTFGWRITGNGMEAELAAARREIVELLEEEPLVPKMIASMLKKNPSTVRRLLQKLAKNGVIVKDGEMYSLASRARE
jgi:predicted transcriptional regulator